MLNEIFKIEDDMKKIRVFIGSLSCRSWFSVQLSNSERPTAVYDSFIEDKSSLAIEEKVFNDKEKNCFSVNYSHIFPVRLFIYCFVD